MNVTLLDQLRIGDQLLDAQKQEWSVCSNPYPEVTRRGKTYVVVNLKRWNGAAWEVLHLSRRNAEGFRALLSVVR